MPIHNANIIAYVVFKKNKVIYSIFQLYFYKYFTNLLITFELTKYQRVVRKNSDKSVIKPESRYSDFQFLQLRVYIIMICICILFVYVFILICE